MTFRLLCVMLYLNFKANYSVLQALSLYLARKRSVVMNMTGLVLAIIGTLGLFAPATYVAKMTPPPKKVERFVFRVIMSGFTAIGMGAAIYEVMKGHWYNLILAAVLFLTSPAYFLNVIRKPVIIVRASGLGEEFDTFCSRCWAITPLDNPNWLVDGDYITGTCSRCGNANKIHDPEGKLKAILVARFESRFATETPSECHH